MTEYHSVLPVILREWRHSSASESSHASEDTDTLPDNHNTCGELGNGHYN